MDTVVNNVAYSVQVATSATSTGEARLQASKFCNDYVQSTPAPELCEVGFLLVTHSDPIVVRTGLQFIEHVSKFHWQTMERRDQIKEKLMSFMQNGTTFASDKCPTFLQEALARVIVEIAKREWPQLWPNLFPQLFDIANSSDLSLLVLRRMVEDVATLQTVDCLERRRELSQSLTAIAPQVISTFFRVLIQSVEQYRATALESYQRRAKICLGCLLPYIEWTNPSLFAKENMLSTLFSLLEDFYFQLSSAECIIQLLERKPLRKEDRFEIPSLCLSNDVFSHFINACTAAQPNNVDFLRKLGDIINCLSNNAVINKVNVDNFLKGCEKMATREEAVAVMGSTIALNHFVKSLEKEMPKEASKDIVTGIDNYLTRLIGSILNKFVTVPPKSSEWEDMNRLKAEYAMLVRSVGRRVPVLYTQVHDWLVNAICNSSSVQNYQWEALTLVVDSVASSVASNDATTVKIGLMDLETCYTKFNLEQSTETKSLILSLISALFVFLSLAKQAGDFSDAHKCLMFSILESTFKCFQCEGDSSSIKEIRRHASALMIKLAMKYPDLIVGAFDFIHSSSAAVASKLSTMEYNNLIESLLLISNVWNDFTKQSAFLGTLFKLEDWQQISTIAESPASFISILPDEVFLEKRALLLRNLHIVFSSLRRVKKLSKQITPLAQINHSVMGNGDAAFSSAMTNGTATSSPGPTAHPAYDHVCPILPVVLKLTKTLHSLIEEADFKYIQDLSDAERSTVLGSHGYFNLDTSDVEKTKSPAEKAKVFYLSLQELVYGILGECCNSFGSQFYTIPQLSGAYLMFVGHNNQLLNDYRLRSVLRMVFRPLLQNCPSNQAPTVLLPFAQKFFPFMLERLIYRWNVIENAKLSEAEGEEEQEVLENASLRLLTKDYVDLIGRLLENDNNVHASRDVNATDMEMDNEVETPALSTGPEIGEIGKILTADQVCFTSMVHCLVLCLCWDDSGTCLKAARIVLLIWPQIVQQYEIVKGTFTTVLRAVCIWQESDPNIDSLLRIMDACFCAHYNDPQFIQLFTDWGAKELDIQKIIALCQIPKSEKKRRDLMRRLIRTNPALEKNKSPKSQWLKGLPQLKLPEVGRQKSPDIDLKECFSLIHK